ncbi:uncharacterized protein LOC117167495 isoform X2 [Belonocnema kinseyi]|uniref:uncharacterized protein LOC117167495 isoform X2 n=1 Tax=Belonocnema kinseyi TaxID=2817044 RepID=UPI00143DF7A6|nr:uncharacterized protein LOC117167495 isoform X2 [Belonocnema kinseyi]
MGDESLKTFGIVIRALRSLAEIQLLTPQQILNYVSTQYNIPKEKIKRKQEILNLQPENPKIWERFLSDARNSAY